MECPVSGSPNSSGPHSGGVQHTSALDWKKRWVSINKRGGCGVPCCWKSKQQRATVRDTGNLWLSASQVIGADMWQTGADHEGGHGTLHPGHPSDRLAGFRSAMQQLMHDMSNIHDMWLSV